MATMTGFQTDALHLETSRISFKRILVATDFSSVAEKAFESALEMAKQFGAELTIANVITPMVYPDRPDMIGPKILDVEESAAWTAMMRIADSPALKDVTHREIVRFGPVVSTIEELVAEFGIDLVVVGTHGGKGLQKLLLGSVAESLLRECSCPVLTVGPKAKPALRALNSILFTTSLTADSLRANHYAVSLAEMTYANVTLLHVVNGHPPKNHALAAEIRNALKVRMRELLPADAADWCRPTIKVESGKPSEEILQAAKNARADLIVLSPHDSKALPDHAPWATVSKVIADAPCPVLTVRAHFHTSV